MKVRITFKDPDGVYEAIDDAVKESLKTDGLDKDEAEAISELRHEKVSRVLSKWVEYGEYVTVEFDTDAGTAIVVEKGK